MLKRMVLKCVTGFALLFATANCYAERAPNQYASWKDCKVGTSVKVEEKDSYHPDKVRYEMAKLVKIDGDEMTVEESSDGPDNKPYSHRISPPEKPSATQPTAHKSTTQPADEGDGEIEIAGHKVKGHWTKETRGDTVTTIWTSDEVPGGFCQISEVSKGRDGDRVRSWTVVEINRP